MGASAPSPWRRTAGNFVTRSDRPDRASPPAHNHSVRLKRLGSSAVSPGASPAAGAPPWTGEDAGRSLVGPVATGVLTGAAVGLLAFEDGGYFPVHWGVMLVLAGLGLVASVAVPHLARRPSRPQWTLVAALGGLALWSAGSALWSTADGPAVLEGQRTLAVAAVVLLACLLLRRHAVPALAAGIVAGGLAAAAYGLATRLYPGDVGGAYDPSSGYQLFEPLGYWNALGLLLAIAILVALGLARTRAPIVQAAAAAAVVPLSVALFFTFSRGAVVALAAGLALAAVADRRRGRLPLEVGVLAVVPAVAVWMASRRTALTAPGATLGTAQAEGHDLAWKLGVLTVLAAVVAVAGLRLVRVPAVARVGAIAAVILTLTGVLGGAAGALAALGGPADAWDRASAAFRSQEASGQEDLPGRILSVSGHGRSDYWRVALHMVEDAPVLGTGAATFERHWLRERPVPENARDAHNLYLETLAELGPLGLLLVLVALATPFAALPRLRDDPVGLGLSASLAAFCVHAAIDWDWEIPVLPVVALACGAAMLTLARGAPRVATGPTPRPGRAPMAIALVGCAVIAVGVVAHVGNRAADASDVALGVGDLARAEAEARTARSWMPWSATPWQQLGEAQLAGARDEAARASLEEAVARDPDVWSAWLSLGALPRSGDAALDRAEALNPLAAEVSDLRDASRTNS